MPELGVPRENIVFVSGIGCSSRFPYYMNTYGMHSIHGRAPAIATGLASTSRPDLSVWVVTGDGDALSIGGNHLIHALRRNVNLKILLFNNRIYGLTKGQYSPDVRARQDHQVDADGLARQPVQPDLAGARRRGHVRRPHPRLRPQAPARRCCARPPTHQGTALVEIYQNCNIFNDGAFDVAQGRRHPRRLDDPAGARRAAALRRRTARRRSCGTGQRRACRSVDGVAGDDPRVVVHDAHADDPSYAFALSRLSGSDLHYTPMGVFRSVERATYDGMLNEQLDRARAAAEPDLAGLLAGNDTWTVY